MDSKKQTEALITPIHLKQSQIFDEIEIKPQITFDYILNKIGFGIYHIKIWIIFAFLGMADGAESIVLSFIIPVFNNVFSGQFDFDLSTALGTFVYLGFFLGSLFSGFATDHFGRKRPVIFACILMITFCLLSAYPPTIYFFILFRSLFGAVDGFFSPFAYIYLAEMTPAKHRGRYICSLGLNYVFGELITCVVAMLTLTSLSTGNWRALLIWSTGPAILALISSWLFLEESARYEMSRGRFTKGIELLKKIFRQNQKSEKDLMSQDEEIELIKNCNELKHSQADENINNVSIGQIFKGKYLLITIISWFTWFVNTLSFNGVTYILPSVLEKLNQGGNANNNTDEFDVGSVIYSCLSEIPSLLIVIAVIDIKGLGRRLTMAICFCCGGIFCYLASIQMYPGLIFWISATKGLFSVAWTINYQYTSELYPTILRGRGLGLAASVGKFGSVLMPYICSLLFNIGTLAPFMMFGALSLIAGVFTMMIPFDTTRLEVDEIDKLGKKSQKVVSQS